MNISNSNYHNSSTSSDSESTGLVVLLLSISVGLIGFTAHVLVALFTIRSKYHVCHIITSISIAEAVLCAYDGFWTSSTFALQQPLGSREFSFTAYIFFGASTNCDVLLALNRFIATRRPQLYKTLFTQSRTRLYLIKVWIMACITCIPYGIPGCRFVVDYKMFKIAYEDTPCGKALSFAAQTFGTVSLVAIVLNVLALSKLKESRKALKGALDKKESERRSQRELIFFIQSCVTSLTTCLIIVCINYLSWALHDRWSLYFVTSLMPIALISIEGIVLLCLNTEARNAFKATLQRFKSVNASSNGEGTGGRIKNKGNDGRTAKTTTTTVSKVAARSQVDVPIPGCAQVVAVS